MDTILQTGKEPKTNGKVLLAALAAGVLLVAAIFGFWAMRETPEEISQTALENAFREGSPEFATYTKRISAQTDEDRTTQSMTGMGTMMMNIAGIIRNNSDKTLSGLEIKVGVVDSFNQVLKEKTLIVVPKQRPQLSPGEAMTVNVLMEGFEKDADRANIRWKVTAIKTE